jgi:adenylate kinase/phosphoserine phosphatase
MRVWIALGVARKILVCGIQGVGKTTMLRKISEVSDHMTWYDGSWVMQHVSGLESMKDFDRLPQQDQDAVRCKAIEFLKKKSVQRAHPIVVSGHLTLRNIQSGELRDVWGRWDEEFYTDVVLLTSSAEEVFSRRKSDVHRNRSTDDRLIRDELEREHAKFNQISSRKKQRMHTIQVSKTNGFEELIHLLEPPRRRTLEADHPLHSFERNWESIQRTLSEISLDGIEWVALLDADRTLTPEDSTHRIFSSTNTLDWGRYVESFIHHGYRFEGYREAALEVGNLDGYSYLSECETAGIEVELYPGVDALFSALVANNVLPIILTSGSESIWRSAVQNRIEIPDSCRVIGGLHPTIDRRIISKECKGRVVNWFHSNGVRCLAVGDSEGDEAMLSIADVSVVASNHRGNRDLLPFLSRNDVYFWARGDATIPVGMKQFYPHLLEELI